MALSVEDVEKLRAAGFSDQDILEYQKTEDTAPAPVDPNAPPVAESGLPIISEALPTSGPLTQPMPESSMYETALGMFPGALELGKDLLTLGAGGVGIYGAAKLPGIANRGFEAWKEASRAKIATADVEKMAEQGRQARFNAKIENDMLKADEMRMKNDELRAKNDAIRQSRAASAERPVVFRQQPPGVTPGAGGQVPVQGPPSANNYMQRMNNLAEQYRGVNPVINPPTQPQPAQPQPAPKMTYRPVQGGGMRGGGGGGGGGGMGPFDPNKRWRPMQF